MVLDTSSHWLADARQCRSSNFDERPDPQAIDCVVIHGISLPPGQFGQGHVQAFFCNRLSLSVHPWFQRLAAVRVSAHLLIERTGIMTQFVGFDKRAWHAGQSSLNGRPRCNDYSIGIELEGTDATPYSDAQYRQLQQVIGLLQRQYPALTTARIVGHSDIALGRKTDPGPAFDWLRLRRLLAAQASADPGYDRSHS